MQNDIFLVSLFLYFCANELLIHQREGELWNVPGIAKRIKSEKIYQVNLPIDFGAGSDFSRNLFDAAPHRIHKEERGRINKYLRIFEAIKLLL